MQPTGSYSYPMQPTGSYSYPMQPTGSYSYPMQLTGSYSYSMWLTGSYSYQMRLTGSTVIRCNQLEVTVTVDWLILASFGHNMQETDNIICCPIILKSAMHTFHSRGVLASGSLITSNRASSIHELMWCWLKNSASKLRASMALQNRLALADVIIQLYWSTTVKLRCW